MIVLQTRALKIINKGGGRKTKTEKIKGGMVKISTGAKIDGMDYVVFVCPGCDTRNKKRMADHKGIHYETKAVSFLCHGCMNMVEVQRPFEGPKIVIA